MKITVIRLERCDWEPTEYEAHVQWSHWAQIGYGETPLKAARSAWRRIKEQATHEITRTLTL